MNGYMGFDEWFVFVTALAGAITGYCVFTLKRWDVPIILFAIWFCLVLFEYWLQNQEFENWKRKVFGQ
jgi:fatty acid desaturase